MEHVSPHVYDMENFAALFATFPQHGELGAMTPSSAASFAARPSSPRSLLDPLPPLGLIVAPNFLAD
jgi:hypothetical protein